jgi:3-deoxy-manno-octulosonate cytidylyltransferase (CMP-KDO synthetase)
VLENRILGVLPARLRAERLPGKPLVEIGGRPLIEWVWRRVSGFASIDACVIATDSERIEAVCRGFGAKVELTSAAHPSGTDRIAEVAARPAWSAYDIIVNVQGDEPLIDESAVAAAIEQIRSGMDIGTVATPIREVSAYADPSVVKVTRRHDGAALYFSRAPIPYRRGGAPDEADLETGLWLRHVGVYAFRRDALRRWVALPSHPLEETERLEQLRPLAAGLTIGVGLVESAERGVDTPEDVERVAARLLTIAQEHTPIAREARP